MLSFSFLSFLSFDKEIKPKAGISTRDKIKLKVQNAKLYFHIL
jgi:hypothetical protein